MPSPTLLRHHWNDSLKIESPLPSILRPARILQQLLGHNLKPVPGRAEQGCFAVKNNVNRHFPQQRRKAALVFEYFHKLPGL